MTFVVTPRDVLDLQDAIQTAGEPVEYTPAGGTALSIRARVRVLNAVELANSIEAYPIECTFDARDFATRAPLKGDSVTIENTRRGVMQVREVRGSGRLIAYKVGVQG
jgi:hypothetical protein